MLIRRCEVEGRGPLDVRLRDGRIEEIGVDLARHAGEECIDADGGALLPGLHDHHIHLFALAAARSSLPCGPPDVTSAAALQQALRDAPGNGWIRGVGYHESVAGPLDRSVLDAWVPARPVRIQHRTGALWVLNSRALAEVGLVPGAAAETPVERGDDGEPTGRCFDADRWLRERLPDASVPSLRDVGNHLAACGVVGVTDASVHNAEPELRALSRAIASGELPQRVLAMGTSGASGHPHPGVECGAVKLVLAERRLPTFEALVDAIRDAHSRARAVAIHCVTRAELVLACTALAASGARRGDRIEHASIAPPDCVELLAALPVTVVTQPGFLWDRGDAYLRDVDAADQPWLYRGRGFVEAGVALGGGTDAPYGNADPWVGMRAAVDRRSAAGRILGRDEALTADRALALFTTDAAAPGGPQRRVAPGAAADLCLLDRSFADAARDGPGSGCVALTLREGTPIYRRSAR